mgnify:CR=1 FL=1
MKKRKIIIFIFIKINFLKKYDIFFFPGSWLLKFRVTMTKLHNNIFRYDIRSIPYLEY